MGVPPLPAQPGGDGTTHAALSPPAAVGVVLAGGASRRMGRDKAILSVGGETLPARAASRLLAVCARVVIADGGRGLLADLQSLPDGPGAGPAAGILGAARAWPGQPLLVLACDLPRVPAALLAELAGGNGRPAAADWVVPRWERGLEPLCALYRPAALAALAAAVARGVAAPHRLAEGAALAVDYLEGERLRRFGPPAELFLNLNTEGELATWQRLEALQPPSTTVFTPPSVQTGQGQTWRRKSKR